MYGYITGTLDVTVHEAHWMYGYITGTLDVWVHYRHIECMGTLQAHWMHGYIKGTLDVWVHYTAGVYHSPKDAAIGHFEKKANKHTKRYSHTQNMTRFQSCSYDFIY